MLYIKNDSDEPYYNQALEEYVFNTLKAEEDILLLWRNKPSVIIGRSQNALEVINVDNIRKKRIYIVRRISEGEAFYTDRETINYGLIGSNDEGSTEAPGFPVSIYKNLQKMGVPVEFSPGSAIMARNQKIGWNTQYQNNSKILYRGVLFFNTNFEEMQAALAVKDGKPIRRRDCPALENYAAISALLGDSMSTKQFCADLLDGIFAGRAITEYGLTNKDIAKVKEFVAEKYFTWRWNYGTLS